MLLYCFLIHVYYNDNDVVIKSVIRTEMIMCSHTATTIIPLLPSYEQKLER